MIDQDYAASPSLHSLPSELHDHILQLACDGSCFPTPAISLSRVSHYWSNLARPHRYTVIHLKFNFLPILLAQLQHLPPNDRRAQILQITDVIIRDTGDVSDSIDSTDDGLRCLTYFKELLTLVSATLRSLSISLKHFMYASHSFNRVWMIQFPALETLEMNGYYTFPRPPIAEEQANTDETESSAITNFPRLENLTLDGVSNPFGLLGKGCLDASIPHLKVLDIRGLRCAPFFTHHIRDALSSRIAYHSMPNRNRAAIPPKLQSLCLTIKPESNGSNGRLARPEVPMHEQMLREMEDLEDFVAKAKWKEGERVSVKIVRL